LAVYFRDITDQKKAQEAVARARQDWERTFDSVPDLIAIMDAQHRVVRVNRAMADRLGIKADEFIGQLCHDCVHGTKCPPAFCPHTLTMQDGREHVAEIHEERLGGDFLVSTTPLRDEAGLVVGSVHVARDITERKRQEVALMRAKQQLDLANALLEEKVQERTAKLRETITDLEQFSYSISHDMRAPLRAMSGFSALLLEECQQSLSGEHVDYLRRIASAAQRMDDLIRDVLTYSRVVRGELTLVPVDLDTLVTDILRHYPHLQAHRAEVEVLHPLLPLVGHTTLLTQCLSNLLDNAIKFVAPGIRPRLRLWTERCETRIRVCVRDNGIGIASSQLHRIWRLFERGHHQNEYAGTGIGLSVVKRAVERMGGIVGVESQPDQGSTFWFELPAG
jgi:PAS domain S-box-containing protein